MAPARRADASSGVTPIAAAAICRGLNASTFGGVVRRRRDASESREVGSLNSGPTSCVTVSDSPALSAWPQLAGGNLPGVCGRGLGTGTVRLRLSGFGGGRRSGGVDIGRSPSRSSGRQVTALGAAPARPARCSTPWGLGRCKSQMYSNFNVTTTTKSKRSPSYSPRLRVHTQPYYLLTSQR